MVANNDGLSSLAQMNQRMQEWMNQKPTRDFGSELRLFEGDIMLGHFVANGDEGDRFIKIYRSHIVQAISKNGKPYNESRYCPIQSGDNLDCPLCNQGHNDIKERMSMWFLVYNIMHRTMPPEKNFPQVPFQGTVMFNEEVNGFKLWHASAWRESPWNDINTLGQLHKGLHKFVAQLACIGSGLNRRYKLYPMPESGALPPEFYERAKSECQDIGDMLRAEINNPIQLRPAQNQNTPTQHVQPFVMAGQQNTNFNYGAPAMVVAPPPNTEQNPPASTPQDEFRPMQKLF